MISKDEASAALEDYTRRQHDANDRCPGLYLDTIEFVSTLLRDYDEYPMQQPPAEGESVLIRFPSGTGPVFLTDNEKTALVAFLNDDYVAGDMDGSGYSWSVSDAIACKLHITCHGAAGVIGSLCKKCLMRTDGDMVSLTPYGREWLVMYRPKDEAVSWNLTGSGRSMADIAHDAKTLIMIATGGVI